MSSKKQNETVVEEKCGGENISASEIFKKVAEATKKKIPLYKRAAIVTTKVVMSLLVFGLAYVGYLAISEGGVKVSMNNGVEISAATFDQIQKAKESGLREGRTLGISEGVRKERNRSTWSRAKEFFGFDPN